MKNSTNSMKQQYPHDLHHTNMGSETETDEGSFSSSPDTRGRSASCSTSSRSNASKTYSIHQISDCASATSSVESDNHHHHHHDDNDNETTLNIEQCGKRKRNTEEGSAAKKSGYSINAQDGKTMLGQNSVRFANLIQSQPTLGISVPEAAQQLGTSKRRIYDIAHILLGANLIRMERFRRGKDTMIFWNCPSQKESNGSERDYIQKLQNESEQLDSWMNSLLQRKKIDRRHLQMNKDDLIKLNTAGEKEQVHLVLTSQKGTVLTVDPANEYSIHISTPMTKKRNSNTDLTNAYLLERGVMRDLEMAPPPPLLTKCCSGFSVEAIHSVMAGTTDIDEPTQDITPLTFCLSDDAIPQWKGNPMLADPTRTPFHAIPQSPIVHPYS